MLSSSIFEGLCTITCLFISFILIYLFYKGHNPRCKKKETKLLIDKNLFQLQHIELTIDSIFSIIRDSFMSLIVISGFIAQASIVKRNNRFNYPNEDGM